MFDIYGVAGGGSGAAGAFISPKFSKSGALKEILNKSFAYSMKFYEKNFPDIFRKTELIHIANDEESSSMLKNYKKETEFELKSPSKEFIHTLTPYANKYESICLNTGIVDASRMCMAMSKNAKHVKEKVDSLIYDDGMWIINDTYCAKSVVLATGAYEAVVKEPYINLRGIWGHRIDIRTTTHNKYSIHQDLSISQSYDGEVAIGATHNVHFNPEISKEPYDLDKGRAELLEKAEKTIKLDGVEVLRDFTGLRSGSVDYMPLVGSIVLSQETLNSCKNITNGKKYSYNDFTYYPNLYMINGSAGYGFVLAPYLAKILKESILSGKKIDETLSPARFFPRWAKRL